MFARTKDKTIKNTGKSKGKYFAFRTRVKLDKNGDIKEANYGKIYGPINYGNGVRKIQFTYYFNPTPNDRNLEFNPKANLFKNLTSLEEVSAP